MKKLFNMFLLACLIAFFAFLLNKRFFINYEYSNLKSAVYEIEQALESIE